eukprot:15463083-Alexandrium_andersonii.AAC.1
MSDGSWPAGGVLHGWSGASGMAARTCHGRHGNSEERAWSVQQCAWLIVILSAFRHNIHTPFPPIKPESTRDRVT